MPATIFSGNNVKALKSNLDLNGVTKILSVNADPASGAGVAAPLGSIAMDYLAGKVYKKTGSLDTEWQELGSGIGGINYIENSDAESGTAGWSTYADAAGSAPVDGTGGTANITWSRSTTSPLRGVADFNLVKDAVNRQGQGVSYDFTIDSADQAKILTISADYEVLSGTFATGDLAVYVIQDPAGTPVVLQPAGYQVTAGTNGNKLRLAATFQTASNVTSYRLCIHVASVSALAYTLAFDSIAVSPQQVVYGAPVTDWQSYTPTFTGFGTSTGIDVYWRRVGSDIQVRGSFTPGTTTATEARISLPSGLTTATDSVENTIIGTYGRTATSTSHGGFIIKQNAVAYVKMSPATTFSGANDTAVSSANGSAVSGGGGDRITFEFFTPILGWSSSVVVSSSTDTRVVAAYVSGTSTSVGVNTTITPTTVVKDTHGAWSGSVYTVPVAGYYSISGLIQAGSNVATYYEIYYKQNALSAVLLSGQRVPSGTANLYAAGSAVVYCNANDTLSFIANNQGTAQAPIAFTASISRLSGPSQIAASETVAARYEATGNRTPTTAKAINYDTKVFDTHGAVTTVSGDVAGWKFTAPVSGKYSVSLSNYMSTAAVSTLQLCKNGSLYAWMASNNIANVAQHSTTIVDVIAGDTIDIRADGTPTCVNVTAKILSVSIHRIGN